MPPRRNVGTGPNKIGRGVHSPTLDRCEPSLSEQQRYKAYRVLIYADMVKQTGKIQWAQLATWDYQPTEDEITNCIAEYTEYKAGQRAKEKVRLERQAELALAESA